MSETKTTYTHDDVMQALCCLARFQDLGASVAAADVLAAHESGVSSARGFVYSTDGSALLNFGPCDARVSMGALRLMAEAHSAMDHRVRETDRLCGFGRYDLRPPRE